jgi:hypothetical protein
MRKRFSQNLRLDEGLQTRDKPLEYHGSFSAVPSRTQGLDSRRFHNNKQRFAVGAGLILSTPAIIQMRQMMDRSLLILP